MGRDDGKFARIMETNEQYHARRESELRLAFERKIVRKFLDASGVTALQRRVMESQWQTDDNQGYYLTLGWFTEMYENFPFILTTAEKTWKPRAMEIFNPSSRSSTLWNFWRDLRDQIPKEVIKTKQVGIVIPCSQESGLSPALVMHNSPYLQDGPFKHPPKNPVHVRLVSKRDGSYLFVQHIDYFVSQVALTWQAT